MNGTSTLIRRLRAHRWVVAASLLVMVVLALLEEVSVYTSIVGGLLIGLSAMLAPVQSRRSREKVKIERVDASETIHAIFDGLPDPVVLLQTNGSVAYSNAAFDRIFGRLERGSSLMMRLRSPELQDLIRATLRGEKKAPVEFNWAGGENSWFACSAWQISNREELVVFFRDLTDAKRTDRVRSDFIANASHELRTPLASLSGFIETLAGPARNDAQARDKFLAIMQDQAGRMSRLIDDLLTLSRFETARGRVNYTEIDLADVLNHVVDALRPMAEGQGAHVTINAPSAVRVHGSRDELIQLFENLVENAIKYGKQDGHVVVAIEALNSQSKVRIAIKDDGPGIPPEHLPRLVERFYRVDVDTSRGKQGTGLGLSIVKHIVQRHQGTMKIESEVGKGTTFFVTLPLRA